MDSQDGFNKIRRLRRTSRQHKISNVGLKNRCKLYGNTWQCQAHDLQMHSVSMPTFGLNMRITTRFLAEMLGR